MLKEKELCYRITGCVYEEYRQLGCGFLVRVVAMPSAEAIVVFGGGTAPLQFGPVYPNLGPAGESGELTLRMMGRHPGMHRFRLAFVLDELFL